MHDISDEENTSFHEEEGKRKKLESTDEAAEEVSKVECVWQEHVIFTELKEKFFKARRFRNLNDMLIIGELVSSLCEDDYLEAIRFKVEGLYANKHFEKAVLFLSNKPKFLKDPHVALMYAECQLGMGGSHIRECYFFLQDLYQTIKEEKLYEPLKYLFGLVCEFDARELTALEVYESIFKRGGITQPKVWIKLFGSQALTLNSAKRLLSITAFREDERFIAHLCAGFVCAYHEDTKLEDILPFELDMDKACDGGLTEVSSSLSSNYLLKIKGKTETNAKEVLDLILKSYPTAYLPSMLKFGSINIGIQARYQYNRKDYVMAYSLAKLLISGGVSALSIDVLPIYVNCCILLGLSAELKVFSEQLSNKGVQSSICLYTKGAYLSMINKNDLAIEALRASIEVSQEVYDSVFFATHISLGHALSLQAASDQAYRAYHLMAHIFAGDYSSRLFMGMELVKQSYYVDARACLEAARLLAPFVGLVYHEIAVIDLYEERYEDAISNALMACKLCPIGSKSFDDAFYLLLAKAYIDSVLFENKSTKEERSVCEDRIWKALSILREIVDICPESSDTLAALAICEYLVGSVEAAIDHFIKALHLDPAFEAAQIFLTEALKNFFSLNRMVKILGKEVKDRVATVDDRVLEENLNELFEISLDEVKSKRLNYRTHERGRFFGKEQHFEDGIFSSPQNILRRADSSHMDEMCMPWTQADWLFFTGPENQHMFEDRIKAELSAHAAESTKDQPLEDSDSIFASLPKQHDSISHQLDFQQLLHNVLKKY